MTTPMFNVGGLMSGLDTNSIIQQLMDVERIPMQRLQQRQSDYQRKVDAWQSVNTRFTALETAAEKLKDLSDFAGFTKATSSSEEHVTVTTTSGAAVGGLSFKVDNLAQAHQMSSATSFTGSGALVGAGTFSITVGATTHDFTTLASTTVAGLARQINESDAGVTASVVALDGTNYKLVLTAKETGTSKAFTASGTQAGLGTFDVLQAAEDAKLTIGEGASALTVTRSSNTIFDLMAGVTLSLRKESTTTVSVSVAQDLDGAIAAVKSFVDEANRAISELSALTKYNAESKKAGLLQGDSTARSLLNDLRSSIMNVVDQLGGQYSFASSVGVELQRDGSIQLDETKLRAAFEDDFGAVARLFARSGSAADTRLRFGSALDVTEAGSYNVEITRAAELATATGSPYVAPGADEVFEIISGTKTVSVTVAGGSSLSAAVSAINSALANAGVTTLAASDNGGALQLIESRYGSAVSFQVTNDDSFGLTGTYAGVDVAGTIDGQPATGSGQSLKSNVEDAPTEGFSVIVSATQAEVAAAGGTLALGSIGYSQGIAGRLASFIDRAQAAQGPITTSGNHWNTRIDTVKKQMAGLEVRLELKETNLRRQFAAMEAALSKLASQGNWLAAQLGQQAQT